MRKKIYYSSSLLALVTLSALLFGCGTQSSTGGGIPVAQPITSATTSPSVSSSSSTSPSTSKSATATATVQPSSSSTVPASVGQTKGTGTSSSSPAKSTPSTQKGSTTGLAPKVPSTATVSGMTLVKLSVQRDGSRTGFVPSSTTVDFVWVPSGWVMQAITSTPSGTVVSMRDARDTSQVLREVIQTDKRDIQGFYDNMNAVQANAAEWVVQGQSLIFTQANPSFPYEDRGVVANLATGGSIRVDLYVPDSFSGAADKVLYSFLGASASAN